MWHAIKNLWADEAGFIISAELVLVATIVGLAMVAGLAEVSSAVNYELNDVANSFSAWNDPHGGRNTRSNEIGPTRPQHEQSAGDFYGNR